MNKILLLAFIVLLCGNSVEAVKRCCVCDYGIPPIRCLRGKGKCRVGHKQMCKYTTVKRNNEALYAITGCTHPGDMCNDIIVDNETMIKVWCSRKYNFCF